MPDSNSSYADPITTVASKMRSSTIETLAPIHAPVTLNEPEQGAAIDRHQSGKPNVDGQTAVAKASPNSRLPSRVSRLVPNSQKPDGSAARPIAILLAFAALYLCWGGTFLAIRIAVTEVPPIMTIAIRCAGGAIVLALLLAVRRDGVRPSLAEWGVAALSGIFLFVGCHALLAEVELRVSSGQAALFMTAIPMWLVVLLAWQSRRLPRAMEVVALAIGTLGVALLTGGEGTHHASVRDGIVLILSALAWALGTIIARDRLTRLPALQATAMQLAGGAAALLVVSLFFGEPAVWDPSATSARTAWAMIFLIFGGTAAGFGAYMWLFRVVSPSAIGSYAFVNPIVALIIGAIAGDEVLSWRSLVSALLVVVAVIVLQRSSAGASRQSTTGPETSSRQRRRLQPLSRSMASQEGR